MVAPCVSVTWGQIRNLLFTFFFIRKGFLNKRAKHCSPYVSTRGLWLYFFLNFFLAFFGTLLHYVMQKRRVGWNHLQHCAYSCHLRAWEFCFLAKKNNRKIAPAKATAILASHAVVFRGVVLPSSNESTRPFSGKAYSYSHARKAKRDLSRLAIEAFSFWYDF